MSCHVDSKCVARSSFTSCLLRHCFSRLYCTLSAFSYIFLPDKFSRYCLRLMCGLSYCSRFPMIFLYLAIGRLSFKSICITSVTTDAPIMIRHFHLPHISCVAFELRHTISMGYLLQFIACQEIFKQLLHSKFPSPLHIQPSSNFHKSHSYKTLPFSICYPKLHSLLYDNIYTAQHISTSLLDHPPRCQLIDAIFHRRTSIILRCRPSGSRFYSRSLLRRLVFRALVLIRC